MSASLHVLLARRAHEILVLVDFRVVVERDSARVDGDSALFHIVVEVFDIRVGEVLVSADVEHWIFLRGELFKFVKSYPFVFFCIRKYPRYAAPESVGIEVVFFVADVADCGFRDFHAEFFDGAVDVREVAEFGNPNRFFSDAVFFHQRAQLFDFWNQHALLHAAPVVWVDIHDVEIAAATLF